MNNQNDLPTNLLPEAMVKIVFALSQESPDDATGQWAAQVLDREVRRQDTIRRWVSYLEQPGGIALPELEFSSGGTAISAAANVVRAVYRLGAERAVYMHIVSPAELLQLVFDPRESPPLPL